MAASLTFIVVMVSSVYAYVQAYQIITTKYMQGFICQLYLNQAAFLKKRKSKENRSLCVMYIM